jgi:hypothetical protein
MAALRPFERADLHAVAALLRANLPAWTSEERIPRSLAGTFLDAPWTDEDLPSLVAMDEGGAIIGFIGCQVRRFRLDERTLRGVCISHLTVDPSHRAGAAGALLLRHVFSGGQDIIYSDTANEEVVRMWNAFGGYLDGVRACEWMVVLRPTRWLRTLAASKLPRRQREGDPVPVSALPHSAIKPWSGKSGLAEPEPGTSGEDVDAAAIVEHLPQLTAGIRLRVDYDEPFLNHLFGEIEAQCGRLVRRLVRRDDRVLGWYAYLPRPGGVSRVLEVFTTSRDGAAVVGEMLTHAHDQGSAVITGRLEPHLIRPLRPQVPVLGLARQPVIHSKDPEIRATLATGSALLTRLDAEWFVP